MRLRLCVLRAGTPWHLPAPADVRLEDGTTLRVEQTLPPDLPLGYHDILPADGSAPVRLIKCPAHCYVADGLRMWGWAVQLYALRSCAELGHRATWPTCAAWANGRGSWGPGRCWSIRCPLPLRSSRRRPVPYYPSSRRFRNPLYLCIDEVPGAGDGGRGTGPLGRPTARR